MKLFNTVIALRRFLPVLPWRRAISGKYSSLTLDLLAEVFEVALVEHRAALDELLVK